MYGVFFGNGIIQILYVILAGYAYDTLIIDYRTNGDAAAAYAVEQLRIEFLNFFAFTAFFDITLTMYFTAWYQAQSGTLDQLAENKKEVADAAADAVADSEPAQLIAFWDYFKNLANASYMLESEWLTVSE